MKERTLMLACYLNMSGDIAKLKVNSPRNHYTNEV